MKQWFSLEDVLHWMSLQILPELSSLVFVHKAADSLSLPLLDGKLCFGLMASDLLGTKLVHVARSYQRLLGGDTQGWEPQWLSLVRRSIFLGGQNNYG